MAAEVRGMVGGITSAHCDRMRTRRLHTLWETRLRAHENPAVSCGLVIHNARDIFIES
jgi:hypothetical protein